MRAGAQLSPVPRLMSDGEIALSYRDAAYPKEQIDILAQLNDCEKGTIIKILEYKGYDVTKRPLRPESTKQISRVNPFSTEKAMEAYLSGMNDRQIADFVGTKLYTIFAWRKKNGLPANCKGKQSLRK